MNTKYCNKCDQIKPVVEFGTRAAAKDKLQSHCKQCMKSASEQWRQRNKQRKLSKQKIRLIETLERWRAFKLAKGCLTCSETEPVCLEHHHTSDDKEINLSSAVTRGWSWERILSEAVKGVIVCSNCHKKIHAGLIELPNSQPHK
jgi:hypothetical protein